VVTSLALSFADDHLENETVVLGSAPDLNHVDLLRDARLILDLQNDIVRRIAYTRLTSLFFDAGRGEPTKCEFRYFNRPIAIAATSFWRRCRGDEF
jgi:hypothetical protein